MNLLAEKLETGVAVKNILFATDFSAISETALPYVTALSLRYGSTIHVAHVLPPPVLLRPGAPDPAVMGAIRAPTRVSVIDEWDSSFTVGDW